MREFKFRSWREKSEGMINIDVLAISPVEWNCEGTGVSLAYQPHINVMQYTGCDDANGDEIYEGDTCKIWGEEPYSNENITTDHDWEMKGKVIFEDGCFWVKTNANDYISFIDYVNSDMFLLVTGNIHE